MERKWAMKIWHASFSIIGGFLYFYCVLPRWHELMGDWSRGVCMTGRIASGAFIGLAALPVVLTLLHARKPELGTPQLALTIRVWSTVAHVVAGVLIIGTAISEIWLSLDAAGQYLFGIYGAAAAIAVLGIFGFYLSFVAELPPPAPKPIKLKEPKSKQKRKGRTKRSKDEDAESEADEVTETEEATEEADEETDDEGDETEEAEAAEETEEAEEAEIGEAETTEVKLSDSDEQQDEPEDELEDEPEAAETAEESVPNSQATVEIPKPEPDGEALTQQAPLPKPTKPTKDTDVTQVAEKPRPRLQNRRPTGKTSHRRRRPRGGVAVDD
jgi:hypothetical protein